MSSTLLTTSVSRLILAPTMLTAVAFVVKGYASAGDGFSAGVVAGTAVVVQFMAVGPRELANRFPLLRYAPWLTFGGLLLGLLTAFVPVALGDPVLTHYPRPDEHVPHLGLLAMHTAILFDIAVFLIVFGFIVSLLGLIGGIGVEGETQ